MSLLEKIKNKRLSARKKSDKYVTSMLTTLIGGLENNAKKTGKEVTDANVVDLIKSYIKNNKKSISEMSDINCEQAVSLSNDNDFWFDFLPKQLSNDELEAIIKEKIDEGQNIGMIMKYLSANYKDQYEGKNASMIINKLK